MPPPAAPTPPEVPEMLGYRLKRILLGRPLASERISQEKLSQVVAAGVLSPDCISSSAYGSEEMLRILVPAVGIAAFTLVIPITAAILVILAVVTMSYREVVQVYTKAGGSYVVSRDNFGLKTAQVAAAALTIDYTLTVAVQIAAGADALSSAFPAFTPYQVYICIAVLAIMFHGNLRGIREAGKAFAFPTYFYLASLGFLVVVGLTKGFLGDLHAHPVPSARLLGYTSGHAGTGLLLGASVFIMLKALANGGSSLTGLEAVSNGISAFRPPVARNARRVLAFIAISLGTLVFGVSMIAHWTHAVPYNLGSPTVVSQEVRYVLGTTGFGKVFFYVLQFATMIILFTGGNTSFNGFPYLASFVAGDSFLPRWLTRRGHRLVFSNGILVLTGVALVLLIVTKARLDSLIALYAIGVFMGFTMAGAGLVKHHLHNRDRGWRRRTLINGSASVLSAVVVVVFAVTKFTEGAWVVVVLIPLMVLALIRLHNQYEIEAEELEEGAPRVTEVPIMRRHVVCVMVDHLDLAVLRALRYGRSLAPDEFRAVHFAIDSKRAADLSAAWQRLALSRIPLEIVESPDRRLVRASIHYTAALITDEETQVTVLLPRRTFERGWSRVLHDRSADRISEGVSQLPRVTATIIPFHLGKRGGQERESPARPLPAHRPTVGVSRTDLTPLPPDAGGSTELPALPGTVPIGDVRYRQMVTVVGKVRSVSIQPSQGVHNLECMFGDTTGTLSLVFMGRREVAGIGPGAKMMVHGRVGEQCGRLVMLNPAYEFVEPIP